MKAIIKDNQLIITIDLQKPAPSKTGKSMIVASTNGFQASESTVDEKPVMISVNAYIPK